MKALDQFPFEKPKQYYAGLLDNDFKSLEKFWKRMCFLYNQIESIKKQGMPEKEKQHTLCALKALMIYEIKRFRAYILIFLENHKRGSDYAGYIARVSNELTYDIDASVSTEIEISNPISELVLNYLSPISSFLEKELNEKSLKLEILKKEAAPHLGDKNAKIKKMESEIILFKEAIKKCRYEIELVQSGKVKNNIRNISELITTHLNANTLTEFENALSAALAQINQDYSHLSRELQGTSDLKMQMSIVNQMLKLVNQYDYVESILNVVTNSKNNKINVEYHQWRVNNIFDAGPLSKVKFRRDPLSYSLQYYQDEFIEEYNENVTTRFSTLSPDFFTSVQQRKKFEEVIIHPLLEGRYWDLTMAPLKLFGLTGYNYSVEYLKSKFGSISKILSEISDFDSFLQATDTLAVDLLPVEIGGTHQLVYAPRLSIDPITSQNKLSLNPIDLMVAQYLKDQGYYILLQAKNLIVHKEFDKAAKLLKENQENIKFLSVKKSLKNTIQSLEIVSPLNDIFSAFNGTNVELMHINDELTFVHNAIRETNARIQISKKKTDDDSDNKEITALEHELFSLTEKKNELENLIKKYISDKIFLAKDQFSKVSVQSKEKLYDTIKSFGVPENILNFINQSDVSVFDAMEELNQLYFMPPAKLPGYITNKLSDKTLSPLIGLLEANEGLFPQLRDSKLNKFLKELQLLMPIIKELMDAQEAAKTQSENPKLYEILLKASRNISEIILTINPAQFSTPQLKDCFAYIKSNSYEFNQFLTDSALCINTLNAKQLLIKNLENDKLKISLDNKKEIKKIDEQIKKSKYELFCLYFDMSFFMSYHMENFYNFSKVLLGDKFIKNAGQSDDATTLDVFESIQKIIFHYTKSEYLSAAQMLSQLKKSYPDYIEKVDALLTLCGVKLSVLNVKGHTLDITLGGKAIAVASMLPKVSKLKISKISEEREKLRLIFKSIIADAGSLEGVQSSPFSITSPVSERSSPAFSPKDSPSSISPASSDSLSLSPSPPLRYSPPVRSSESFLGPESSLRPSSSAPSLQSLATELETDRILKSIKDKIKSSTFSSAKHFIAPQRALSQEENLLGSIKKELKNYKNLDLKEKKARLERIKQMVTSYEQENRLSFSKLKGVIMEINELVTTPRKPSTSPRK